MKLTKQETWDVVPPMLFLFVLMLEQVWVFVYVGTQESINIVALHIGGWLVPVWYLSNIAHSALRRKHK